MAKKTQERRAQLKTTLIDLAEAQIRTDGLGSLKARDLATKAECSVGAIYNVFDDLEGLVLEVNARTFKALGKHAAASIPDAPPLDQLIAMAQAYLHFAVANRGTWDALFNLKTLSNEARPDWYLAQMDALFEIISKPLGALRPELSEEDMFLLTRALFSSVHGIVIMGIDNFSGGVPTDKLEKMISIVLKNIAD